MLRNSATHYGAIAKTLHWLIGLLFIGQWILGLASQQVDDPALQFDLYQWHKSFGMLLLALVALRIVWTLASLHPALPASMTSLEQRAARAAHLLLYGALVALPITGWLVASASPLGIPTFAFNRVVIPPLPIARSDAAEALWSTVHATIAYAAAALVALHIAAALYHHLIRRDEVLRRMLP